MKMLNEKGCTNTDWNAHKSLSDLKIEYINRYDRYDFEEDLTDERTDVKKIVADILDYNNAILNCDTLEELADVLTNSDMNYGKFYVEYWVCATTANIWTNTTYILGDLLENGNNESITVNSHSYIQSCVAYDVEERQNYHVYYSIENLDDENIKDSVVKVQKICPEERNTK